MYLRMLVRKQPVQFQVDCGASVNILPLKYAEGEELDSCLQTPVMWNGTKVAPVGSCVLPVVNPKTNEKYKVRLLVVKEHLTPLVDLNATQKMKLLTDTKKKFTNVVENANDDTTVRYVDAFDKCLGTLPGRVHLQGDPDCKHFIPPARKVPESVRKKFKEELQRLERVKVI